jgi:tetratricopeptide (TPR) repeat protein
MRASLFIYIPLAALGSFQPIHYAAAQTPLPNQPVLERSDKPSQHLLAPEHPTEKALTDEQKQMEEAKKKLKDLLKAKLKPEQKEFRNESVLGRVGERSQDLLAPRPENYPIERALSDKETEWANEKVVDLLISKGEDVVKYGAIDEIPAVKAAKIAFQQEFAMYAAGIVAPVPPELVWSVFAYGAAWWAAGQAFDNAIHKGVDIIRTNPVGAPFPAPSVPCIGGHPCAAPPPTTIGPQTRIPDDHVAYSSSTNKPGVSSGSKQDVVERVIRQRLGDDALKRFEDHTKAARANAPMTRQVLFDRAERQFRPYPARRPTAFAGLERWNAPMGGSGGLISRQAVEQTTGIYKSIPGGVVLEGKVSDLGSVRSIRYEPALNAFVLDDRAVYFSPIPPQSAAVLAQAISQDDRIGVAIDPAILFYGMVSEDSDVGLDLMLADLCLGRFFTEAIPCNTPEHELANGFTPRGTQAKTAVLFTFKDFQFAIRDEELQLTATNFDASVVPLAGGKAADGGYLPDLKAISAGVAPQTDLANAILNAKHLGENINYYRRMTIVARVFAYGEVAALFRGLKDARVDLRELARRLAETNPGADPQLLSPTKWEGPWLEYLKKMNYDLAYTHRGNHYFTKYKNYDRALADYDRAIAVNPKEAGSYIDRALAYQWKRDVDRALANYNQAVQIDPNSASAYIFRGLFWVERGNMQRAAADFQQASVIDPSNETTKRLLAGARRGR